MLRWALGFLVLAIVAAFLGFGGIAHASVEIAKVLAYVFLVFFLIALIWTLISGRRRRAG